MYVLYCYFIIILELILLLIRKITEKQYANNSLIHFMFAMSLNWIIFSCAKLMKSTAMLPVTKLKVIKDYEGEK